MTRLEKVTDNIVLNMLRINNYVDGNFNNIQNNVYVWAKQSDNAIIKDILSTSSKKITGNQGYPEYIVFDEVDNIVIVIEDKKDTKFHRYNTIDEKVGVYAVNGALWYASKLKDKFDTIAIGVSGNTIDNMLIDTYGWKKGAETFTNLNLHKICDIDTYRNLMLKVERSIRSVNELKNLTKKAKEINEYLRNYLGVMEHKRLYVLGSILFALEDPTFKMIYSSFNNNKDLALFLYQTIERKTNNSGLKSAETIKVELKPTLEGLGASEKEGSKNLYPNGTLLELVKNVDNILFDYYKNSELDLISVFFNVFLSYSTSGGSDLGIVLTPSHITKLFCEIAEVDINSKILDPCVGTGGFLTSTWKRISLDSKYTHIQKETFRKNNLYGVEKETSIYTIVALNMFLNKDGRSNLYCNDCFSIRDTLKNIGCNVGFINPPYSDEVYSEVKFVELELDCLLPNSIGVAIIPVNAVSSRTKKHSDITAIKKMLLDKHSLIASIQMPGKLFYPKGTETIILVFEAHKQHNGKTWFAQYDDGYELIKNQKMRTPGPNSEKMHNELLEAYRKRAVTPFSFNKRVTAQDQWVYTLHKEIEYTVEIEDLQKTVNDYVAYLIQNKYFSGGIKNG